MTTDQQAQSETVRIATPQELSQIIRILREMRKWSQETLSAVSGLSVRTVQRVEKGEPSDLDTRRALARAFESEDIDVFNKPCAVPSKAQLQAEKEKFERDHVTIACSVVTSGRELANVYVGAAADHSVPAMDLEGGPAQDFAALTDFLRDWRDCWDMVSEVEKLEVYADTQKYLDSLKAAKISVVIATRDVKLTSSTWSDKTAWPVTVFYMVAFETGAEPKELAVRRQIRIG